MSAATAPKQTGMEAVEILQCDQPKGEVMPAATSFQVSFTKEGPVGVQVKADPAGKLEVTSVKADGAVPKYNASNPESQIKVGDLVLTMNGEKASLDILKAIKDGDTVTLQIERPPAASDPKQTGMGAVDVSLGDRPAGVPANAQFIQETYMGPKTQMFALGGCLCCGPLACCILLCPLDEREVWKTEASGMEAEKRWTKDGALVM